MVAIPQRNDPTLQAVDAALEASVERRPRRYLGMSEIGHPCRRRLWYRFRWCWFDSFDASTLKRFEDGHDQEAKQARRLRLVDGLTLHIVDPVTGEQFDVSDHGGHFQGHLDGAIQGLLQAPKAWHVWEHKSTDEKNATKLDKLKGEKGEKDALESWNETYHAQAQCYMHYTGMERHYLTCSTPGGRRTTSARTNYEPETASVLSGKALSIILAPEPLERLSEKPEYYLCKWCEQAPVCHHGKVPEVSCRTCAHATPELDGDGRWSCARHRKDLTTDEQKAGCSDHVLIPALVPLEMVDASAERNTVTYQIPGTKLTIENGTGENSSEELRRFIHERPLGESKNAAA